MAPSDPDFLTAALGLVGVLIVVAALLSGIVERSGLPQVAVFLALGAALGPAGLDVLHVSLDSAAVRVVATLSLVLVLFTDAVTIDLVGLRRHAGLALRVLGPGTLLSALLIALAGWWLLALPPAMAIILGAALASTDPVLLRGLLRRRNLPTGAREALRLESGLNDSVLLPLVLVAMAFLRYGGGPNAAGGAAEPAGVGWARLGLDLFLLGPGAGVAVGLVAVATLDLVRRRIGIRRDYESLYSLGVALAAYAAAEAVHGSGFVAAFVAGLTIVYLDVELCDCFLEYGETTAEMALLFAFVLFGVSLIWTGFTVLDGTTLLFAAVALLVRPAVFFASLAGSNLEPRGRLLVAWFGPRGLSSLLLVLLPVFAGVPGSDRLFAICSLVVLCSVVLHGGAPMLPIWGSRPLRRPAASVRPPDGVPSDAAPPGDGAQSPQPAGGVARTVDGSVDGVDGMVRVARPPSATDLPVQVAATSNGGVDTASPPSLEAEPGGDRISLDNVRRLQARGAPLVLLDVRTERTHQRDATQAAGSIRLPPDHVVERAAEMGLDHEAWLVAYCA